MIAAIACETGIPPDRLLEQSDRMLFTMQAYLRWRAIESQKR